MVKVGAKSVQQRRALASGHLVCSPATLHALHRQAWPKGDVLTAANIAGVQDVKRTAEFIPLCHSLPIQHVELNFIVKPAAMEIICTVATGTKTGVEMEALTGVSVAALTLYDMCKAVDKTMRIEGIHLVKRTKR
jgi:cyclic pyranopterin phosphate synthase